MAGINKKNRIEIKRNIKNNIEGSKNIEKTIEKIVDDEKAVSEFSREYRGSTTLEGAKAIAESLKKAHQATSECFITQKANLEKRMEESKHIEHDLAIRSGFAVEDAGKAKYAAGKISQTDVAKRYLMEAAAGSIEDGYFTDEQRRKAHKCRENSRKKTDYLTNIMQQLMLYSPVTQTAISGANSRSELYGLDVINNPYQDQIDKVNRKENLKRLQKGKKDQIEFTKQMRMQEKLDKAGLKIVTEEKQPPGYIKNKIGYDVNKKKYTGK